MIPSVAENSEPLDWETLLSEIVAVHCNRIYSEIKGTEYRYARGHVAFRHFSGYFLFFCVVLLNVFVHNSV